MKKSIVQLIVILLCLFAVQESKGGYKPPEGMVPNAETAVKIAEVVLVPIYGKEVLKKRPFEAVLEDENWIVTGSLRKGHAGGVPKAKISKESGCVLEVSHSK